jgi:hypothetical protein
MKKIFILAVFLFLIIILPVFADDDTTSGGVEDLMKYTNTAENPFAGQKQFSDEDFQKALKEVKARQNKKKKQTKPFKGASYNEENNGGYIHETAEKNLLLTVPTCLINGDGHEIPVGYYKIVGEKTNDGIYLDFYESSILIAKVPAIETNSDFDQTAMNFVQLMPYNEQRVKIIYGSMDFNAYTFIKIKTQISDTN